MHSEHSLINHSLSIYHMPEMNLVLWGNKKKTINKTETLPSRSQVYERRLTD